MQSGFLAYPAIDKICEIYFDDSKYQLQKVIFNHIWSPFQVEKGWQIGNYTITELQLLSVIKTPKRLRKHYGAIK